MLSTCRFIWRLHALQSVLNNDSFIESPLIKIKSVITDTEYSLNIVFFPRIFNVIRPLPRKNRAAIVCTENGQPIRVTVHSDLRSEELLSYMQGMDCSEFGQKHNL